MNRQDWQASIAALTKAVDELDKCAVLTDDVTAREFYFDTIETIHRIKSYILTEESK